MPVPSDDASFSDGDGGRALVRAGSLDVSWLLALVTDTF